MRVSWEEEFRGCRDLCQLAGLKISVCDLRVRGCLEAHFKKHPSRVYVRVLFWMEVGLGLHRALSHVQRPNLYAFWGVTMSL